jgi:hypothetical protein
MARRIIDIGAVGNDGTGDSIRDSFRKVNENFRELYSSLGLGDRLTFIGLDDTPESYEGEENAILAVGVDSVSGTPGIKFKQLIEGAGIRLDFTSNPNEIEISSEFSSISSDPNPQLGGNLDASSGGNFYKIFNLQGPTNNNEAANKEYVDTKIARAGVNAIDPATNQTNPAFGTMSGPLILARDPEPSDDETYSGLIAATKRYVDNAAFGSIINLYVATSGEDERTGVSSELQGRALAYAYRTLEAALKRAEEIMLQSRLEIGPYKKVLTYDNGSKNATLDFIAESPLSGSGFSGQILMSVDTATVNVLGVNYRPGDIITVVGGTFIEPARYEVLSITEAGGVSTIRQISSGVYTSLPGSSSITTTTNSQFGGLGGGLAVVTLDLTFNVNNVQVTSKGSEYSLVSVRIEGGGGSGAFGTADVVNGEIDSITITDRGRGFTSLPNVILNLPRFLVKTEGFRTDFTGDVTTQTPLAARTRDLREGLYLRGETSGALAQILAHDGSLDSDGNEIFDVDIQFGNFIKDEVLSFGDISRFTQISILVESGIYEENLPLKIPQNVSIVGDEFRRVIVRPRPGVSSSPWAFRYFRRDPVIDGLQVVTQPFGYHYLRDSTQPVYPLINNRGFFDAAAELLRLNRTFIQKEVIAWISFQKQNSIAPFVPNFSYNEILCERDVGLLIDAMIFDLRYGGANRTISAALKYYGAATNLGDPAVAITDQLLETVAAIRKLNSLAQLVIKNVVITELFQTGFIQITDGAFISETGAGGSSINISSVSKTNPVTVSATSSHGLSNGDLIFIDGVSGMTELNGNDFYVSVVNTTTITLYNDASLTNSVDGTGFSDYVSGGFLTNQGGVIGALTEAIVDIISNSNSVNLPKNNDEMDLFLCNDAVRLQAVTGQGHGGFMMVLDPEGQILAKSPYAQECASFSKSTGRQTFAGGMFIDGFAGNLEFQLLGKVVLDADQMSVNRSYTIKTLGTTDFTTVGALSNTVGEVFFATGPATGTGTIEDNSRLLVGDLKRFPQLPASYIVNDTVYRINYVRDYVFNTTGSTATFVLDEVTPWPFKLFEYNDSICRRDVGLIIDGLFYDIIFGSNYNQRKAGLLYRRANARVVIDEQLDLTISAINFAHDLAKEAVSGSTNAQITVDNSKREISEIIRNGPTFANALFLPNPAGLSVDYQNAKNLLLSNIEFIKNQAFEFIDAQIGDTVVPFASGFGYDFDIYSTNIDRLLEAVAYDITYGGNSQSRDEALRYFDGVGDLIELQLDPNEVDEYVAVLNYIKSAVSNIVQNLDPTPLYEGIGRTTGAATTPAIATEIEDLIDISITVLTNGIGSAPTEILPDIDAYVYNVDQKTAAADLVLEKSDIQDSVIVFIDSRANRYEVLMPGNRSMLGNDYTQINDMGYGIVTTNGGLCEAVSMFTYYCYISFYSINGGQIRSVASSSSHGVYGLVAEGADPLEVPTPVTTYFDLAQGATCYFPSGAFANIQGGLQLFVTNYTYEPLPNSELEVDHGTGVIIRYPITSSTSSGLPAGVARLTLASAEGFSFEGLAAQIPNGQKITIRQNATIVLTGDVVDVTTRPSTGLILNESSFVYRILQFSNYTDSTGLKPVTISIGSPTTFFRNNHGLLPDYQISFVTTGSLPTGLDTSIIYYVLPDGITPNSFRISTFKRGVPVSTSGVQTGDQSYTVRGLALTTLRENYDYIELTGWPEQPYRTTSSVCTITIGSPGIVTLNNHGFNTNDVIRFETNGELPGGISTNRMYFVESVLGPNTFTIKDTVTGLSSETFGSQSGTHRVGLVIGTTGDSTFAIVELGTEDEPRVLGSKIVWIGEEYVVTGYQNTTTTGQPYAFLTLDRPLVDGIVFYNSPPTLKSGVAKDERGTLTIRISLTRVTSHDLLEVGTGSYADTNYPNEIYGPSVNPANPANETDERTVGRVFYVTTDQFGNFNVGPFFRVDQGTGTVTFSAAIALSNLDGIGFKRGVTVSEFSTDSSFADNATDTVPTENATRAYIERRLGLTHNGSVLPPENLIPVVSGGFLSLDGQLSMKGNMNLGNNKIINIADPTNAQDAVNFRSLTLANVQDITITSPASANLLSFTGVGNIAENAAVSGDVTFTRTGANALNVQINTGVIVNDDISASAAIVQSKLSLNTATTRANATGITQAERGLASFNSSQFDASNGWISVKNNGIVLGNLAQVATKTVLGNSGDLTANVSAVTFSTVVADGGAIKKSQYTAIGYLRRIGTSNNSDADYTVVDESTANTASTLVKRDSNGNFAAGNVTVARLLVDGKITIDTVVDGTGGYTQYHGFLSQVGILIGDGTNAADKKSFYDNDSHQFRTQNGLSNAPVTTGALTASSVITTSLTSGGAATAGALTGAWSVTGSLSISGAGNLTMGTGTLNIASGTLQSRTLTTGASATTGTVTGNWSLTSGSRFEATYADLAEYYEGDKLYEVGTVLIFGGDKEVTLATKANDHRVAGVVSNTAAYTMNSGCPGEKVCVALQGRVACRVVGKVEKGDLIVTSNIGGVAVAAKGNVQPGTIIGKALENYNSDHIGTIEVAVGRT